MLLIAAHEHPHHNSRVVLGPDKWLLELWAATGSESSVRDGGELGEQ